MSEACGANLWSRRYDWPAHKSVPRYHDTGQSMMHASADHCADEINFDKICIHFRDPRQFFPSRLIQPLITKAQISRKFLNHFLNFADCAFLVSKYILGTCGLIVDWFC